MPLAAYAKVPGLKPLVAHAHLEICFSGFYVGMLIGIKSDFGPLDLGSISAEPYDYNLSQLLSIRCQ